MKVSYKYGSSIQTKVNGALDLAFSQR